MVAPVSDAFGRVSAAPCRLGHDAELAQDRRNVVIAAFLDDLAAFVQPAEHAALQVNALVRRR